MVKQCIICGKEFHAAGNSVTCSPGCSAENARASKRCSNPIPKNEADNMKEIERLSQIAWETGISYGELVRRMEIGIHVISNALKKEEEHR